MTIVSGELRQLFGDATRRQTREDYFKRIYAKTASMFELATEAAGVLIGATEDEIAALRHERKNCREDLCETEPP